VSVISEVYTSVVILLQCYITARIAISSELKTAVECDRKNSAVSDNDYKSLVVPFSGIFFHKFMDIFNQ